MKKSEQTKERILKAAARILSEKGFQETRTAELAAEAGLSEGAIFRYFPTKSNLIEAVVRFLIGELHSELSTVLQDAEGLNEIETLEMIIDFHYGFFSWRGGIVQNLLVASHAKRADVPIQLLVQEGLMPYISKIKSLLESGMNKGIFRRGDSSLMATALLGLMQIIILRKLVMGADYSFADAKAEVKQIFFSGILLQRGEQDAQ
ncbi:MAG TPA: TetR/AcrR family transcriptional regulator [Bacillota bacterium]|nr:TetR/AcrR family transcriptional regulator [Bacillota bacterium]